MNRPASAPTVKAIVPFDKMRPAEQVSELFYLSAVEVTKPAYMAVNRAYPKEDRDSNPKTEYRYQEASRQAKQHLNHFKKLVRDFVEDFVLVKKHASEYDASQDVPTKELRSFLDTQLLFLYKRLTDYAPLLVPADDVESFISVLDSRFNDERKVLAKAILRYEATPKYTKEDFS